MVVLGSGRGLNGRGAPIGSIWAEFQLKRSHGDPIRDQNNVFCLTSISLVLTNCYLVLTNYYLVLTNYYVALTNHYLVVTIDSLVAIDFLVVTRDHLVVTSEFVTTRLCLVTIWYLPVTTSL